MTDQSTAIRAELASREMRRRSLEHYWRRAWKPHAIGAWQIDLCKRLQRFTEAVERRESPCMMVFAPPQMGKSWTVSRAWPAWMLGKHPDWPIILGSYASSLASSHGRWIRNSLNSPWHSQTFTHPDCRLADDSQAMDEFRLVGGGQFLSRGRGGGTTGQPARVFIVDDPFSDRQEAESKTIQETVWEWFWSVAETRLAPGGGKLVMNTRWDERDLSGRLLEHMEKIDGSDKWEVVSYPALAEHGDLLGRKLDEPLHPERFTREMVERKKRNLPTRDWLSMYQQRPTAAEGTFFKVSMINIMDAKLMPRMTRFYTAWDLALKPDQDSDFSVGATIGVDHLGRYWLVDIERGQWDPAEAARKITRNWAKHKSKQVWFEGGPPWLGVQPSLTAEMKRSGIWVPHSEITHGGKSKDVRAIPLRGIVNGGNLYIPSGVPWLTDFLAEMAAFPNGRNDDMCLSSCTYVACSDSWKRITEIKIGDLVWTRKGLKKVTWAGKTGVSKVINVAGLRGTANHPVWTQNRGWVQMGSLNPLDELVCLDNQLSLMGKLTTDTQSLNQNHWQGISTPTPKQKDHQGRSIEMFGRFTLEKLEEGDTSTTSMGQTTTNQIHLNACRFLSMENSTGRAPAKRLLTKGNGLERTEKQKALNKSQEIGNCEKQLQQKELPISEPWQKYLGLFTQTVQSAGKATFMSRPEGLRSSALQDAERLQDTGSDTSLEDVYNLTVEDCHEFFANGVLVHNCDAASYLAIKSQLFQANEDVTPLPKQPIAVERSQMVKRTIAQISRGRVQQTSSRDDW